MTNQTHTNLDNVALLRELLNHNQLERKAIQTELHGQKGNLLLINFVLHRMEKDASEGKFDKAKTEEIKQILSKYMDNLRPVMEQIFSPMIKLSGLQAGLKDIISYCRDKYETQVDIFSDLEHNGKADAITQLGVYKVCFETVQYLCLKGFKQITINVVPAGSCIVVEVQGKSQHKVEIMEDLLLERLNLIKANVVWRAAQILPETNWNNSFRFQFKYENLSN